MTTQGRTNNNRVKDILWPDEFNFTELKFYPPLITKKCNKTKRLKINIHLLEYISNLIKHYKISNIILQTEYVH